MALQLPTGEYVVVEYATEDRVTARFHKDAEQRERYKNKTMNEYEFTKQVEFIVPVNLEGTPDTSKCICDNTITAGYEALKTLPEFANATDLLTILVLRDGSNYWRATNTGLTVSNGKITITLNKYNTEADAKAETNIVETTSVEVDFEGTLPLDEYLEAIATTMELEIVEI